jgi:hypothetical protein
MVKLFVDPNRFVPKLYTNEHVLVAAAALLRPKKVRLPAPASCQNSSKARSKKGADLPQLRAMGKYQWNTDPRQALK